jgi:hypothetical protein
MGGMIVEVEGEQVGLLLPVREGYVFFAARPEVHAIEQKRFPSVQEAQKRAQECLRTVETS